MRSAGTYAGGHAEIKDVEAAIGRIREEAEGPTVVCGWSFGAAVALREAITDERLAGARSHRSAARARGHRHPSHPGSRRSSALRRPTLLLAGEGDVYCPRPRLEALGTRLPEAEVAIVPGTDHFFWRREKEVAEIVGGFAGRLLVVAGSFRGRH